MKSNLDRFFSAFEQEARELRLNSEYVELDEKIDYQSDYPAAFTLSKRAFGILIHDSSISDYERKRILAEVDRLGGYENLID